MASYLGLFQLINLLLLMAVFYTLYSIVSYVNWRRKHATEQDAKLDRLIALLEEQRQP